MNERLLLALGILAIIYLIYRVLFRMHNVQAEDKLDEVINSDKYKVKGQYD